METVTIKIERFVSPEEIILAAKKAVLIDKVYKFEVVDSDGAVWMSVDAFMDRIKFANEALQTMWIHVCEREHIWDFFEKVYPVYCIED